MSKPLRLRGLKFLLWLSGYLLATSKPLRLRGLKYRSGASERNKAKVEALAASWIEISSPLKKSRDFLYKPCGIVSGKQNSKYCKKVIVLWKNDNQRIMSYILRM